MECSVIKDLMPLYIEKLTSEPSNDLILEHVKMCDDCRQTLNKLEAEFSMSKEGESEEAEKLPQELVKRVKTNILAKIVISTSIALVSGVLIALFSVYSSIFTILFSFSIIAFTTAIFISIVISRNKPLLKKRFIALGNWTFVFSIMLSILCYLIFTVFKPGYIEVNKLVFYTFILGVLYNVVLSAVLRIYAKFRLPKNDGEAGNQSNRKLYIVTFCTLVSLTVITVLPASIIDRNKIVDNIDLPFINDSAVMGKWETVDLVKKLDQFQATKKYSKETNFFLKGITFLENGLIDVKYSNDKVKDSDRPKLWLSWTKGYVLDKGGNHTASRYIIREINGSKYMFFEWKSGDYSYFHQPPVYYVLRKSK